MSTVKNLGDPKLEDWIRQRLDALENENPTIRVTVLGSSDSDNVEMKIQNSANEKWQRVLTLNENKTAEKIIALAKEGIAALQKSIRR